MNPPPLNIEIYYYEVVIQWGILLYKAVNNEDEHNNMIKRHSGIMPLNIENYSMATDQSDFSNIIIMITVTYQHIH